MATKEALAMRMLRWSRLLKGTCIYCGQPFVTKTMWTEHAADVTPLNRANC